MDTTDQALLLLRQRMEIYKQISEFISRVTNADLELAKSMMTRTLGTAQPLTMVEYSAQSLEGFSPPDGGDEDLPTTWAQLQLLASYELVKFLKEGKHSDPNVKMLLGMILQDTVFISELLGLSIMQVAQESLKE